ncbi:hypothetical protein GPK34_04265 [Secundilactobacillus kimchicus]|uniref:RNA-directed DNA polymerase n=1 Tax=Secundilactobacillus kimchicus TaxID=528209 RepID=UPI001C00B6D6|nr:RNA-directed DNA polymerase [Secundilactobacillus kimchicus]MBT9671247.1 hypothetical protein [Secundilactobacillus kimchicus]
MANNYFLRTDILPEGIPILFSNLQLYSNINFTENNIKQQLRDSSEKNRISFPKLGKTRIATIQESVPMKFHIKVRRDKDRQLSLLHPIAQLNCLIFVIQFERKILLAASVSPFSVRYPTIRNENQINISESQRKSIMVLESTFSKHQIQHLFSETLIRKYRHYFSFSKVHSLSDLYNSSEFTEAQVKYSYIKKTDIQNFFPSIYTHSLPWVLFKSKQIAKANKHTYSFENNIDKLASNINFSETHGIITGPEFSRTIAELLLCQVDARVERDLAKKDIYQNEDYKVFRFVDDLFIFYNSDNQGDSIMNSFEKNLSNINLTLNKSKTSTFSSSLLASESTTNQVLEYINRFKDRRTSLSQKIFDELHSPEETTIRGSSQDWKVLFSQVIMLSEKNPEDATKIVNYFLASLPYFMNLRPTSSNPRSFLQLLTIFLQGMTNLLKCSPTQKTYSHSYAVFILLIRQIDQAIEENHLPVENKRTYFKLIFHSIANLIAYSWFDVSQGYDFLPILKFFTSIGCYLNSYQLISILRETGAPYFVWTAVGYYIYDSNIYTVNKKYKTVEKVLFNLVHNRIHHFRFKGKDTELWADADWFYLANDFSKYPGFSNAQKSELKAFFRERMSYSKLAKIGEELSKKSYYNWQATFEDLSKEVLQKKIIDRFQNNFSY